MTTSAAPRKPRILLLGGPDQFGIFLTLLLALLLGFTKLEAVAVGSSEPATAHLHLRDLQVRAAHAGAVSVAAYCYMSLVPILQPPIMRALTTQKERRS